MNVPKYIKYKGRCYLLIKCPRQGVPDTPGSTSDSEDREPKFDLPEFEIDEEQGDDYSRQKADYQRVKGEPSPVSVPAGVISSVPENQVVPFNDYSESWYVEPVIEIDMSGGEPNVTKAVNPIPVVTPEVTHSALDSSTTRLVENLVSDTAAAGLQASAAHFDDATNLYHSLEAAVQPTGGAGVKYVSSKGDVTDSVSPLKVVSDAGNKVNHSFGKANAALLAVDAINEVWDAYELGAFDTVDKAVDYFAETIRSIPEGIVNEVGQAVNAVIEDNPKVLAKTALNLVGVPSVVRLADRVASTVTGEDVDLGAQAVDAIIDHAPDSVFVEPKDLGFGPKLSFNNDSWW